MKWQDAAYSSSQRQKSSDLDFAKCSRPKVKISTVQWAVLFLSPSLSLSGNSSPCLLANNLFPFSLLALTAGFPSPYSQMPSLPAKPCPVVHHCHQRDVPAPSASSLQQQPGPDQSPCTVAVPKARCKVDVLPSQRFRLDFKGCSQRFGNLALFVFCPQLEPCSNLFWQCHLSHSHPGRSSTSSFCIPLIKEGRVSTLPPSVKGGHICQEPAQYRLLNAAHR